MKITPTDIRDVLKIKHPVHRDKRGYFQEIYHRPKALEQEFSVQFVQENISKSRRNVLRGLHFQLPQPQAKLVQVLSGTIFDVAVDVRRGSPTFGEWVGHTIQEGTGNQLFMPEGFAHGFCALEDETRILYKCSDVYNPDAERGIRWNDPTLDIQWPIDDPILSKNDAELPMLDQVELPQFGEAH